MGEQTEMTSGFVKKPDPMLTLQTECLFGACYLHILLPEEGQQNS
jgi:hypothetical protein